MVTILALLISLSVILLTIAVLFFRWAVKNHQFDDMTTPSMIPLLDDAIEERERKRVEEKQSASANK